MHLDGQLTQEHPEMADDDHSMRSPGHINDDFDVDEFEREEEEEEEEERINDLVGSDSEDSEDEAAHGHGMPSPIPLQQLHAMPVQGRLATDDEVPYGSFIRLSEAQPFVAPDPYTQAELMQLRSVNVPFSGVPNYRGVSMTDEAVCDTGLHMCMESMYNHEHELLSKGMLFNTLSELKLFMENYAVHHHRPFYVTHSYHKTLYYVACKRGCD